MQGLFFESDTGVRYIIRFIVVLIGFWTANRTGRAAAENWDNYGTVVVYTLLLGLVVRFMHHALFDGPMLSPFYYGIDTVLLLIFSTIGYRYKRTSQMVNNYYWLYEKTSAFSWKKRD